MAVTYTKAQRDKAKESGLFLITLAVPGFEMQAPVSKEEKDRLVQYMTDFARRRSQALNDPSPATP